MAVTLRETMFLNGILTNCEIWYGLTKGDISQLEDIDKLLLRKIFNVASSCPIEALYLELGVIPINMVIKSRRLNYLHYLATRVESGMLHKFFITQWKYPEKRNDWTEQAKLDLAEFEIPEDLDFIKKKSKLSFKQLVRSQVREISLEKLLNAKQKHSKMINLFYVELEIQEYLKEKSINTSQAKAVFKFRTRMANFSENFKGQAGTQPCPLCRLHLDIKFLFQKLVIDFFFRILDIFEIAMYQ